MRALFELCTQRGVTLVDVGATGAASAAEKGLVTMVGGSDDVVARIRPVLDDISSHVIHCGPSGAGMATKLARNLMTYATWATMREATSLEVMRTADASVSPTLHLELLVADYKIRGDRLEWVVDVAEKDLDAVQQLAAEVALEVPLADIARPRMRAVYEGELEEPSSTWNQG